MHRFTHAHDPLLGPPAHVLAEVDAAWERSQELSSGELRAAGDGAFVSRLSACEALAIACGEVELALAA